MLFWSSLFSESRHSVHSDTFCQNVWNKMSLVIIWHFIALTRSRERLLFNSFYTWSCKALQVPFYCDGPHLCILILTLTKILLIISYFNQPCSLTVDATAWAVCCKNCLFVNGDELGRFIVSVLPVTIVSFVVSSLCPKTYKSSKVNKCFECKKY